MLSTNGVCFSVDYFKKKKNTRTEKKFYRAMSENDEENNKKSNKTDFRTDRIFGVFIKTIYTRDNLISYHTHTER